MAASVLLDEDRLAAGLGHSQTIDAGQARLRGLGRSLHLTLLEYM